MITLLLLFLIPHSLHAAPLPRTIIALYDSQEDKSIRTTRIHRMVEMPLNHLGYVVEYHDIRAPLPAMTPNVKGVLIWFRTSTDIPDANAYLDWMIDAIAHGKKLIFFGYYGLGGKYRDTPGGMAHINRLLNLLGVQETNEYVSLTYESKPAFIDRKIMGFERDMNIVLPPFFSAYRTDADAKSYLKIRHSPASDAQSDVVVTNRNGAYVVEDYAIFTDPNTGNQRWYLNPFEFFRTALGDMGPIPDVTTLMGRRIFYSHIDGDGWNNITELEKYKQDRLIAAQVITREIFKAYPFFAFNVGIITADLDPRCYGLRRSIEAALEMLKLPNVEPSSHSHSHPLYWSYFADGRAEKEKKILNRYPARPRDSISIWDSFTGKNNRAWNMVDDTKLPSTANIDPVTGEAMDSVLKKYYGIPRSYACKPFNINDEVAGSIAFINALCPQGKHVQLFQWSGDTSPFQQAIAKTVQAGVWNINGGDTRFDDEYPSYTWVMPIGIKLGNFFQIFSSNSNENTYTHLWTDRFFGFRYLQTTVRNTETPIRIKPFNVYFHMFSGEKQASLNAVKENLDFAKTQRVIPITASRYAAIANGFYTARLTPAGENTWNVDNRGELQTLRFDHATLKMVDFSKSPGVIGARHAQGSLYVTLDRAVPSARVTLTENTGFHLPPPAPTPYLVEGNWSVENVHITDKSFSFNAQGYGNGSLRWYVPNPGTYLIEAHQGEKTLYKSEKNAITSGTLDVDLPVSAIVPLQVIVQKRE